MKRIISAVIIALMAVTAMGTVSAEEVQKVEVTAVPVLISIEKAPFEVEQDGDNFTIIVEENASTGFIWDYIIVDESHVEFTADETVEADTDLVGAPGQRKVSFKVLKDGVSTIRFESKRGDETGEYFVALAYKNGDTVIVEEDQVVTVMDGGAVPTLYTVGTSVTYGGEVVEADVDVQVIDGITMVPLRATLEAMGYTVTWNAETSSVDIMQGAQWTSISIGENRYFRNRMAPWELSAAPVIVDSRTLVPVEFFAEIIGKSIQVDSGNIEFTDFEASIIKGYVHSLAYDETGAMSITVTSVEGSDDMMNHTIIHTSKAFTFFQKEAVEGEMISVVTSNVMTMSIPGQTSGYVVY